MQRNNEILDAFSYFKSIGGSLIYLEPGDKRPGFRGWTEYQMTEDKLNRQLESMPDLNLGLILGEKSGGIVDVDLDDPLARKLGPRYLQRTGTMFGRSDEPRSHLLYRVEVAGKKEVWTDPLDQKTLLELRGDGHQTMIPPSIHPSGEPVIWAQQGQPTDSTWEDLGSRCGILATTVFLTKHWQEWHGSIHFICLSLSGALIRSGLPPSFIEGLIRTVCELNNDSGTDMQVRTVQDTLKKLEEGKEVTGWSTLAKYIGDDSTRMLRRWLGITSFAGEIERNDSSNAKLFAVNFGNDVKYIADTGRWVVWNGLYWESDVRDTVNVIAQEISSIIHQAAATETDKITQKELQKWATQSRNLNRINAMVRLAQSDERCSTITNDYDSDIMLVNTNNGTLNLDTLAFDSPRKEDYLTRSMGTSYTPNAECPQFERFLEQILPDPEVREYVQRVLGYCLTGSIREQKFWLAYGPLAGNGKSTLIQIIASIMGQYAQKANIQSFLVSRNDRSVRQDIMLLRGVHFAYTSEPPKGAQIDAPMIKDFTGGDVMRARGLYQTVEHEFYPKGKLWMNTNHLPRGEQMDLGYWRRVEVIPFTVSIPDEQQDGDLANRILAEEASGVLNWLLEGITNWHRNGLRDKPKQVLEATASYKQMSDSVELFAEDTLAISPESTSKIGRQTLYTTYVHWCHENQLRAISAGDFKDKLAQMGVDTTKIRGKLFYKGVSLQDDNMVSAFNGSPMPVSV